MSDTELRLGVKKKLQRSTVDMGALAVLSPAPSSSKSPVNVSTSGRFKIAVPVGPEGKTRSITLHPGRWLIDVRLPSGERLSKLVELTEGQAETVLLQGSESTHEWMGWASYVSDLPSSKAASTKMSIHLNFESLQTTPNVDSLLEKDSAQLEPFWDSMELSVFQKSMGQPPRKLGSGPPNDVLLAAFPNLHLDRDQKTLCAHINPFAIVLPEGDRICIGFESQALKIPARICSIPLPWGTATTTSIQLFAFDMGTTDGPELATRVYVDDPMLSPVLGFIESGDIQSARAMSDILSGHAEEMLSEKANNPLAATAGAYTLIKLRQYDRLRSWSKHLADRFEWLPDGAVIHAWQLLRPQKGITPQVEEARSYLKKSIMRGPPYFSDGVRLMRELASLLMDEFRQKTIRGCANPDHRAPASNAIDWLDFVVGAVKPKSLFSAFELDFSQNGRASANELINHLFDFPQQL